MVQKNGRIRLGLGLGLGLGHEDKTPLGLFRTVKFLMKNGTIRKEQP
jgi:hypothetical protein